MSTAFVFVTLVAIGGVPEQKARKVGEDRPYVDGTDVLPGCSWYCGGSVQGVTASSTLPAQGANQYKADNAHDFDTRTAWVEGKSGHGIGVHPSCEGSLRDWV